MRKFIIGIVAIAMRHPVRRIGGRAALRGVGPRQHHDHDRDVHGHPARSGVQPVDEALDHNYTVIVNDDSSFSGTGEILGDDQNGPFDVQVPPTSADRDGHRQVRQRHCHAQSTRVDGLVTEFAGALTGDLSLTAPITVATLSKDGQPVSTQQPIENKVSVPVFVTDTTTTTTTESVKNHGQFVKAQGGGKIAAQACAGMPLDSTQGQN